MFRKPNTFNIWHYSLPFPGIYNSYLYTMLTISKKSLKPQFEKFLNPTLHVEKCKVAKLQILHITPYTLHLTHDKNQLKPLVRNLWKLNLGNRSNIDLKIYRTKMVQEISQLQKTDYISPWNWLKSSVSLSNEPEEWQDAHLLSPLRWWTRDSQGRALFTSIVQFLHIAHCKVARLQSFKVASLQDYKLARLHSFFL